MGEAESIAGKPLEGFQRRYLRGLANPIKALVHVGEGGISDAVVGALDDALDHHELVKVRLFQPAD
jgi:RNA-binding protein